MHRVTVVIPTHRRPGFLRSALASVAAQSALDRIARVVVSENSNDDRSRGVCAEFPQLPIHYVLRDPPIPVEQHFIRVVSEADSDRVAMLADDDMWSRHHVAEALRQLDLHPEAVGFFGQIAIVDNDSRQIVFPHGRLIQTYLEPCSTAFSEASIWGPREVLLECALRTPLNIWSLVGRSASILRALSFLGEGRSGLDSDRFFFWRLACEGPIVVSPEFSLFMRMHSDNNAKRLHAEDSAFHDRMQYEYTGLMLQEAESLGIDWRSEWLVWWNRLGPGQQQAVWGRRLPAAGRAFLERFGSRFVPPRESSRFQFLAPVMPPILAAIARRSVNQWRRRRADP